MAELSLEFVLHRLVCPHCQKRTRHHWPGETILFATAKCERCGKEFLIVQNKPWLDDDPTIGSREIAKPTSGRRTKQPAR